MFRWQYVNVDPVEVARVQQIFKEHLPQNLHFFQNLEINIHEFMNIPVVQCALIQVGPLAQGKIHTDVRIKYGGVLAINIPLMNCENSVTELWSTSSHPDAEFTVNNAPHSVFERQNCTKIDEYVLDRPVIFRTDIPHSVKNNGILPRRAISLRFKDDPWHLVDEKNK